MNYPFGNIQAEGYFYFFTVQLSLSKFWYSALFLIDWNLRNPVEVGRIFNTKVIRRPWEQRHFCTVIALRPGRDVSLPWVLWFKGLAFALVWLWHTQVMKNSQGHWETSLRDYPLPLCFRYLIPHNSFKSTFMLVWPLPWAHSPVSRLRQAMSQDKWNMEPETVKQPNSLQPSSKPQSPIFPNQGHSE